MILSVANYKRLFKLIAAFQTRGLGTANLKFNMVGEGFTLVNCYMVEDEKVTFLSEQKRR